MDKEQQTSYQPLGPDDEAKWFKRKKYGYGLTPANWKGWLFTAAFVGWVVYLVFNSELDNPSNSDVTWFFVKFAISIAIFWAIAVAKGEKMKWQWGKRK